MPDADVVEESTFDTPDQAVNLLDIEAVLLGRMLGEHLHAGSLRTPRSRQERMGPSEVGNPCDRAITYKLTKTPKVNLRDPLASMVGTGFHLAAREAIQAVYEGSGRFLTEHPVSYRGIAGHLDLYDRFTRTVVDWKVKPKTKLRRVRYDGPQPAYVVQSQIYAAGLVAYGERPEHVALAYVPSDGELSELYVWRSNVDQSVADKAIDRVERLVGVNPSSATPTPSRLCPWCPWYRPGSTMPANGCPGEST